MNIFETFILKIMSCSLQISLSLFYRIFTAADYHKQQKLHLHQYQSTAIEIQNRAEQKCWGFEEWSWRMRAVSVQFRNADEKLFDVQRIVHHSSKDAQKTLGFTLALIRKSN